MIDRIKAMTLPHLFKSSRTLKSVDKPLYIHTGRLNKLSNTVQYDLLGVVPIVSSIVFLMLSSYYVFICLLETFQNIPSIVPNTP